MRVIVSVALFSALVLPIRARAQSLQQFEKKVTEFTLPNGLHFLIIERHEAPVVSFHTYVSVGSVDDPTGETGMAHMFEHMAFKGTQTIGTKNWAAEHAAMDAVERIYDRLDQERNKGLRDSTSGTPSITRSRAWFCERSSLTSNARSTTCWI